MYRKISANQSAITLRPPPGTRFSIFGQDVELQYADAQQEELFDWLDGWLKAYVKPLARRAAIPVPAETKPALVEETTAAPEANADISAATEAVTETLPTSDELKELTALLDTLVKEGGVTEALRRLKNSNATETNDEKQGE